MRKEYKTIYSTRNIIGSKTYEELSTSLIFKEKQVKATRISISKDFFNYRDSSKEM